MRIVLYLNQFFGQLGGEEVADAPPRLVGDVVGPGRALLPLLQPGEELVGTIVCGDSYFADHPEDAAEACLRLLRDLQPRLLLAGPAFNAGRYGVACGELCRRAGSDLGIAAVTGMYAENPGVELYRRDVTIVRTGHNAGSMRQVLDTMLRLGRDLVAGRPLAPPDQAGYYAHGLRRAGVGSAVAARRASDMLLAKLHGQPFTTEVPLPKFEPPPPAPAPLADLRDKVVALVTDGGLVPAGNPDGIESAAATRFGVYSIAGQDRLSPEDYEVSHGGYDNRYVRADPNRLVPVDAARELERQGRIGKLYDKYVVTTGLTNPVQNSRRLGREIADHLKQAGVDAVILTST
jgi:glycine reductase complex component B subunit gamma